MTRPPLRAALEDYLSLRRALGFKLNNAGRLLGQFVGYLEERGINTITTDDALAWASLPAIATSFFFLLLMVWSHFCKFSTVLA